MELENNSELNSLRSRYNLQLEDILNKYKSKTYTLDVTKREIKALILEYRQEERKLNAKMSAATAEYLWEMDDLIDAMLAMLEERRQQQQPKRTLQPLDVVAPPNPDIFNHLYDTFELGINVSEQAVWERAQQIFALFEIPQRIFIPRFEDRTFRFEAPAKAELKPHHTVALAVVMDTLLRERMISSPRFAPKPALGPKSKLEELLEEVQRGKVSGIKLPNPGDGPKLIPKG